MKYVLGVTQDFVKIAALTLCEHRTRFTESGIIFSLLARLQADTKAKDLISEDKLQIVDSFVVCGVGAVRDSYTLLRKGIVQILKVVRFH